MFQPWVGTTYGQADNALGGRRLMILGESHHSGAPDAVGTCDPDFTRMVVRELALEGRHPFFAKLSGLIDGRPRWQISDQENAALWQSLMFYNYVPVIAAAWSREAPTDEMFRAGASLLPQVIAEHKPQAILVCGGRLWWWVLKGIGHPGKPNETQFVDLHGVPAAHIRHPSAGFSYDRWRPVYRELLTRIHP